MSCGCGGTPRNGRSNGDIVGFDYISPSGSSYYEANGAYLSSLPEARAEQRINGGGTIKTIRISG